MLLNRAPAIAALEDAFGESIARLRVITPVEVIDQESFPES